MRNGKLRGFLTFFCGAFFLGAVASLVAQDGDLYKEFQPEKSSRVRESIEWSIIYMFGTNDDSKPRALLIGDSICNGYQSVVCDRLEEKMNVTYWAGSQCVTDPVYFKALDLLLSSNHYDVISFNNGLHSLGTDRAEWENAYRQAVKFIRTKLPDAKLLLVTNTPVEKPEDSAKSKELGDLAKQIAKENRLEVIDLYDVTEKCGEKAPWRDGVHFIQSVIEIQGETVADALWNAVK